MLARNCEDAAVRYARAKQLVGWQASPIWLGLGRTRTIESMQWQHRNKVIVGHNMDGPIMIQLARYHDDRDTGTDLPAKDDRVKTARNTKAVGRRALVPRMITGSRHGKTETILDFGAGPEAQHVKDLREKGLTVTAYDLPENQTALHDPKALESVYDVVYCSNVLNVQPSRVEVMKLLYQLKQVCGPSSTLYMNYPAAPRKWRTTFYPAGVPAVVMEALIFEVMEQEPVIGAGTLQAPVWIVKFREGKTPYWS
jgi:hypothetical protein